MHPIRRHRRSVKLHDSGSNAVLLLMMTQQKEVRMCVKLQVWCDP